MIPRLGLGAAPFGNLYGEVEEGVAHATVDAALEAGVRFLDTAPHYGLGLSERRLGAALVGRPREDLVLSTKVGRVLERVDDVRGDDTANGFHVPAAYRRRVDLTPAGLRRSLDDSLGRLGVDRVDVVLLHDPEEIGTPDEARRALAELARWRDEGVVRAVGVGTKSVDAADDLVAQGGVDVVMLAGRHTLLEQPALDLLDRCAAAGTQVVAVGVFNSGILARPRPAPGATYEYGPASGDVLARAHALADVCESYGVTLPHAAVQLPLLHPAVVNVTVGLRSPAEVADLVRWSSEPVPGDLWDELVDRALLDPRAVGR